MLLKYMRFLPHFAVYLLLKNSENQILMSKRANTGFMDGYYSLPSGHVDENESATEALERESLEEINITPTNYKLVHTLHIKTVTQNIETTYVSLFFESERFNGEIINLEKEKCEELIWVDINNLPTNVIPDLAMVINHIKKGQN
jgi:mutator protein MutT